MNTVWEKPIPPRPPGSSSARAVMISPSPWPKSVFTLVWCWAKETMSVSLRVIRIEERHAGCARPWRKSSVRVQLSFTGTPMARETSAASRAASQKRSRPKDPPPCTTCTVTTSWGSPRAAAMSCWATTGFFIGPQISARSARTSATHGFVSSGQLGWKANVKLKSLVCTGDGMPSGLSTPVSGMTWGSSASASAACTDSSDIPAAGPGAHSTSITWSASMHWPKVRARTATPLSTSATWVTPGTASTAASLRSRTGRPRCVGGRATIVGRASGTTRSPVYRSSPVTMARASIRFCGVPTMRGRSRFGWTSTASVTCDAASRASSPKPSELPSGARMTPSRMPSSAPADPRAMAAASSSRCRATAAAIRTGS